MNSNITINIVEPGSGPVVPDTGLFTSGISGSTTATIITIASVSLLAIAAIYIYIYIESINKTNSLVH